MHPAPSVIIFTTLSGLGFGLMMFLGLGFLDVSGWVAFVFVAIAYALAGGDCCPRCSIWAIPNAL